MKCPVFCGQQVKPGFVSADWVPDSGQSPGRPPCVCTLSCANTKNSHLIYTCFSHFLKSVSRIVKLFPCRLLLPPHSPARGQDHAWLETLSGTRRPVLWIVLQQRAVCLTCGRKARWSREDDGTPAVFGPSSPSRARSTAPHGHHTRWVLSTFESWSGGVRGVDVTCQPRASCCGTASLVSGPFLLILRVKWELSS